MMGNGQVGKVVLAGRQAAPVVHIDQRDPLQEGGVDHLNLHRVLVAERVMIRSPQVDPQRVQARQNIVR